MVGSNRITCSENGELGHPVLSGLFLERSVSRAFFALVSNVGVDCVRFRSSREPASPLSFSAGSGYGRKPRRSLIYFPVLLTIEESNEWLQKGGSLYGEKGLGLKEGEEEQKVGFNGWESLNPVVRLWAEELFPMASRMFLDPFKRLKHQYIISQGKKNLSESAKGLGESQGWRGFGQRQDVDFLGAEQLLKLCCHEKFTKLNGFISRVTNSLAETVSSVPIHTESYQKNNRCTFEDDCDGRMLPPILDLIPYAFRWSPLFAKGGGRDDSGNKERMPFGVSTNSSSNKRQWTNILLALNVLVFVAQIASKGKLTSWGAKINSLIERGEIWRLGTSSLLHANIGHLMVNCFSLNSVGPVVEAIGGRNRFLAVYVASAFASSATSYTFCRSPAVGASGAIFGLVGSYAMFVWRHRSVFEDEKHDLLHIVRVIAINMAIGLLSKEIDNWGHLGGLLGGAGVSWLVGPAWTYQYTRNDGRQVFADKPPLHYFCKP
ncbi:uncharacterized protein LOC116262396 isoform X2 [Nymphaea colorata]|uniref:uncharacterized protein LOC116262396 isoform X2 n=1 Tax=Nymphaea colorata TaxID=210225 RepID=UPI00129EE4D7|nr:uncharacterized protein LOC116262396 isoform X2 [Nymphaea colorata]